MVYKNFMDTYKKGFLFFLAAKFYVLIIRNWLFISWLALNANMLILANVSHVSEMSSLIVLYIVCVFQVMFICAKREAALTAKTQSIDTEHWYRAVGISMPQRCASLGWAIWQNKILFDNHTSILFARHRNWQYDRKFHANNTVTCKKYWKVFHSVYLFFSIQHHCITLRCLSYWQMSLNLKRSIKPFYNFKVGYINFCSIAEIKISSSKKETSATKLLLVMYWGLLLCIETYCYVLRPFGMYWG